MAYKKHNWLKYGSNNDLIEIKLKDQTGRTIDRFQTNDRKNYRKILEIVRDSYGWDFQAKTKQEIDTEVKNEISLLKKEMLL